MLSFEVGTATFVHRTAAVAIDCSRVLLHRSELDDFWALPGGRVEVLENLQDAIVREMRQEIGAAGSGKFAGPP